MKPMIVNIYNETQTDIKSYEQTIQAIFKTIEESYEFNVIFVTDEKIKTLNKTYRNIDKITDVLSFPDQDDNYIGDIFIALDQAIRQAKDYHHSIEREVGFLTTHGYLHLLGYDHDTKENEKIMRDIQETILKKAHLERM